MLSRTSARQQRMRQQTLEEERMAQSHSQPKTSAERRSSGSKLIISSPTTSSHPAFVPNLSSCQFPGGSDENLKLGNQCNRGLSASALLASLSGTGQRAAVLPSSIGASSDNSNVNTQCRFYASGNTSEARSSLPDQRFSKSFGSDASNSKISDSNSSALHHSNEKINPLYVQSGDIKGRRSLPSVSQPHPASMAGLQTPQNDESISPFAGLTSNSEMGAVDMESNNSPTPSDLNSPMESCFANIMEDQGSDSFDLNNITPSINLSSSVGVSGSLLDYSHQEGDSTEGLRHSTLNPPESGIHITNAEYSAQLRRDGKASSSCPADALKPSPSEESPLQSGHLIPEPVLSESGSSLAGTSIPDVPNSQSNPVGVTALVNLSSRHVDDQRVAWIRDRTKKDSHNRIERKRRDYINCQIAELGSLLPEEMFRDGDGKKNKGSILKNSVEFICLLRNELAQIPEVRRETNLAAKVIGQLVKRIQELESHSSISQNQNSLGEYQGLLQEWLILHENNTRNCPPNPATSPTSRYNFPPGVETAGSSSPGLSSIGTEELMGSDPKSIYPAPNSNVIVGSAPSPSNPLTNYARINSPISNVNVFTRTPSTTESPLRLMRTRCTSLTVSTTGANNGVDVVGFHGLRIHPSDPQSQMNRIRQPRLLPTHQSPQLRIYQQSGNPTVTSGQLRGPSGQGRPIQQQQQQQQQQSYSNQLQRSPQHQMSAPRQAHIIRGSSGLPTGGGTMSGDYDMGPGGCLSASLPANVNPLLCGLPQDRGSSERNDDRIIFVKQSTEKTAVTQQSSTKITRFFNIKDPAFQQRSKQIQGNQRVEQVRLQIPSNIWLDEVVQCDLDRIVWAQIRTVNRIGVGLQSQAHPINLNDWYQAKFLRKVIAHPIKNGETPKARILLSWKPDFTMQNQHSTNFIHWLRVDPITNASMSAVSTRVLSWPRSEISARNTEILISIDDVLLDSTYVFRVQSSDGSHLVETPKPIKCLDEPQLKVHISTYDKSLSVPLLIPHPPVEQLWSGIPTDQFTSNCYSASVTLVWPPYPTSLKLTRPDSKTSKLIYTASVRNYSLEYVIIPKAAKSLHHLQRFDDRDWIRCSQTPLVGQENGFHVDGLQPNTAYRFRLSAQTTAGPTPFSLPSDVITTRPAPPCESPTNLKATVSAIENKKTFPVNNLNLHELKTDGTSFCDVVIVQWDTIPTSTWNSNLGQYHLIYRPWPPKPHNSDRHLFTKIKPTTNFPSTYRFKLVNLIPNTYYEIQVAAINDWGEGPWTNPILIHSENSCPVDREYFVTTNMAIDSQELDMLQHEKQEFQHKQIRNFVCTSDNYRVLIRCNWISSKNPKLLGYRIKLSSYGPVDHVVQKPLSTKSIFIGPNSNQVSLFSLPSAISSLKLQASSNNLSPFAINNTSLVQEPIIHPYEAYIITIQAVTYDGAESTISYPSQIGHHSNWSQFQPADYCRAIYLCTTESPPSQPTRLRVSWISTTSVRIHWSKPEFINGKLIGFKLLIYYKWKDQSILNNPSGLNATTNDVLRIDLPATHHDYIFSQMNPNTTYIIQLLARSQSKVQDGWGWPSCTAVTTDRCPPDTLLSGPADDISCSSILHRLSSTFTKTPSLCSTNLPILNRPLLISDIGNTTMQFNYPMLDLISRQSNRSMNPLDLPLQLTQKDRLILVWSPISQPSNLVPTTQFLIEFRHSRQMEQWFTLRTLNGSTTSYIFHLRDLNQLITPTWDCSSWDIDQLSSLKNSLDFDKQSVTATYANARISPNSCSHIAVQFRIYAASPFHLSVPSEGSRWVIMETQITNSTILRSWWFIILIGIMGFFILLALIILLRYRMRNQFHDTSVWSKKLQNDSLQMDCCLTHDMCHKINHSEKPYPNSNLSNRPVCTNAHSVITTVRNPLGPSCMMDPNLDHGFSNISDVFLPPDSTVDSKAPSNRTTSTNEMDRVDDGAFNQSTHRMIASLYSQRLLKYEDSPSPQIQYVIHPQSIKLLEASNSPNSDMIAKSMATVNNLNQWTIPTNCSGAAGALSNGYNYLDVTLHSRRSADLHQPTYVDHSRCMGALRDQGHHVPKTALIQLDNTLTRRQSATHNRCSPNFGQPILHLHSDTGFYDVDLPTTDQTLCHNHVLDSRNSFRSDDSTLAVQPHSDQMPSLFLCMPDKEIRDQVLDPPIMSAALTDQFHQDVRSNPLYAFNENRQICPGYDDSHRHFSHRYQDDEPHQQFVHWIAPTSTLTSCDLGNSQPIVQNQFSSSPVHPNMPEVSNLLISGSINNRRSRIQPRQPETEMLASTEV